MSADYIFAAVILLAPIVCGIILGLRENRLQKKKAGFYDFLKANQETVHKILEIEDQRIEETQEEIQKLEERINKLEAMEWH
jgi:D-alanine-D-alanine ligase-like ATP-grasp enzyme